MNGRNEPGDSVFAKPANRQVDFKSCQQRLIASMRDTVRVPFHYDLPLPKLHEERPGAESVRLVSWLVEEGALLARGTPVAIVSTGGGSYEVRANGEGLRRKRLVSEGQAPGRERSGDDRG
jgi:hypothetical protein